MEEKIYRIEQPKRTDDNIKLMIDIMFDNSMQPLFTRANLPYLHWTELKNKDWLPSDKINFWHALHLQRRSHSMFLPIQDKKRNKFKVNIPLFTKQLHIFDKEMGGNLMGIAPNAKSKQLFITRNLMDEAIISSQIEGANTTRAVARKMLLENRSPRTKSEKMIVNNHRAMMLIEEKLRHEPLSMGLLFELHNIITKDTIDQEKQGVLRETFDENGKPLVIEPWDRNNEISYIAPPKEFVEQELPKLIAFANASDDDEPFVHPIIKAIILHFWIGLLHPFEDGNGRLARIIFYWFVLRKDYWTFAYISLSEFIYKSKTQYAMAYIYSEQDDNDLTYFVDYNMRQIERAREKFLDFVRSSVSEETKKSRLLKSDHNFNERQTHLLLEMYNGKCEYVTITSYAASNAIAEITAMNDLKKLVKHNLLERQKRGRNSFYIPTDKVAELFRK